MTRDGARCARSGAAWQRGVLRLVAAALLGAALAASVHAQPSPLPKAAPANAAATPEAKAGDADTSASREQIRAELEAARTRLAAIEASPDQALDAPPSTPPGEISARLALARQLTGLYQQQLDLLDRLDIARTERTDADKALESWSGFATPPPYSVLVVDGLRDDEENAEARIASATARRGLFDRLTSELAPRLRASQSSARLAAEAAERARGTPDYPQLAWRHELALAQSKVDDATRELLEMAARNSREETAGATAVRDLARRKLIAAGDGITFPEDDLARVRSELAGRRLAVQRELDRSARASAAAIDARVAADKRVAQARAQPTLAGESADARAERIASLARDAEVRREQAATVNLRGDLLKQYLLMLDGEQTAWEARADAARAHDPIASRAAYERLTASLATVRAWDEYLAQQLAATRARVREQESRLRTVTGDEAAQATQLLDTYRDREADLNRAIESGKPLQRLLTRFRADFEGRRQVSFWERVQDAAAATFLAVRRVWNFEVFTVDDSYQTVDGRKLDVTRSITLGRTVGAMLIVVVGYLLFSGIARLVERFFVRRTQVARQSAALLRNWIVFLLTLCLIIFALLQANIPLTAFAFLGGALAIAAGFGLQTLLKNFVAGIMLLFERPMRLDDLVEVDGIRGRVTSIGIRASTLTSADGIETMIPNSAFIENKLTNWTYTSPTTRHTVKIGVAYGTPLRKAADALQDAAARHGLVLKEPAPQVYLEEYADSAVVFALTYWVDMSPTGDSRRIRSDVLHMIDRAFADAGIRMPFPQRDVHLDATGPLRVEVVAPAPKDAAPTG